MARMQQLNTQLESKLTRQIPLPILVNPNRSVKILSFDFFEKILKCRLVESRNYMIFNALNALNLLSLH
jgi:hypothetical protein